MNNPTHPDKHPQIAAAKAAEPTKASSPNPWDVIEVGATVLHRASKDEGYFECSVTAISKDKKTLTLKWRDYPSFKPFDVRRLSVGLVCKLS